MSELTDALPDWVLCLIYSAWSEETWCAGWMDSGVRDPRFVTWLREQSARTLEGYEQEDLPALRKAFLRAARGTEAETAQPSERKARSRRDAPKAKGRAAVQRGIPEKGRKTA